MNNSLYVESLCRNAFVTELTCNALSSAFSSSVTSSAPTSMACSTAASSGIFSDGLASITPLWSNNPGIEPSVNEALSEY